MYPGHGRKVGDFPQLSVGPDGEHHIDDLVVPQQARSEVYLFFKPSIFFGEGDTHFPIDPHHFVASELHYLISPLNPGVLKGLIL